MLTTTLTFVRAYRTTATLITLPIVLSEYFNKETGEEYDVGLFDKLVLIYKFIRNQRAVPTGSTVIEHLIIATEILRIPAETEGSIIECGCYKGGSTANLSLVASLCDRRLDVFDSFQGMAEPSERDRTHTVLTNRKVKTYETGAWSGSRQEVEANISRYGDRSVCRFHAGFFDETMPEFNRRCALLFLDVGLRESAETCLQNLWPLLQDEAYIFAHDANHMEISGLFFDTLWWQREFDRAPPGLIGAGSGLGLHPQPGGFGSLLAYTIKNPQLSAFERVAETGA